MHAKNIVCSTRYCLNFTVIFYATHIDCKHVPDECDHQWWAMNYENFIFLSNEWIVLGLAGVDETIEKEETNVSKTIIFLTILQIIHTFWLVVFFWLKLLASFDKKLTGLQFESFSEWMEGMGLWVHLSKVSKHAVLHAHSSCNPLNYHSCIQAKHFHHAHGNHVTTKMSWKPEALCLADAASVDEERTGVAEGTKTAEDAGKKIKDEELVARWQRGVKECNFRKFRRV